MDWEVEAESDPDLMAALLFFKIIPMGDSDLTDTQEVFLSLLLDILSLYTSDLTESEFESKLIPRITQWISILPCMDLDPLSSEPVLELESLIANKTSVDKLKRQLIAPIHQIYSMVVSSPESKPKWEKKPKNLICLSPQLKLYFEKGKFSVTGDIEWSSDSNEECWFNERKQGIYFHCQNCNGKYHEEYQKAPVEIKNHHLHPKHHLQLATPGLLDKGRECYCCDDDLLWVFYYCSACDFAMNVACVEKPPLSLAIDHPKWHEHTLALFARHAPLNCSLCALADLNSPIYMCPPCGFVAHLRCIRNLPRVIKISRHPHRISFTHSFDQGDWSCGICRRKIDNDYGGYSCIKDGCSYAAHSKCATQSNVWDGKELEGEPEEVEDEDIEPFVRISEGIIQHFSHQHHHLKLDENKSGDYDDDKLCQACRRQHHHLKLDENKSGDYDDDKLCQACITPIYFGSFYSCLQCDFILHEACANLSRKIHHPIHPHRLVLVGEHDGDTNEYNICSACPKHCTGFTYKCSRERCRFKLHLQCATISEPLIHESHMHPLFLTSKPGEWRTCLVCKDYLYNDRETFNCIECNFALCFACATLPQKVRYKHDKHVLTLSYGEETSSLVYWCEACERKIDLKEQFYTCAEDCCVTLHVECLLGLTFYMRPGSSFPHSSKRLDVVRNNRMTRPICERCKERCEDRVYFHRLGSIFCSLHCAP